MEDPNGRSRCPLADAGGPAVHLGCVVANRHRIGISRGGVAAKHSTLSIRTFARPWLAKLSRAGVKAPGDLSVTGLGY
jgi:hypothetical protein